MFAHILNTINGKCPACEHRTLFANRFKINDICSKCGLTFQDNDDGTWFFLLMIDRAFFIFPLVVMMYFGFDPWHIFFIGILLVLLLIAGSPVRMGISVAIDYYFKTRLSKKKKIPINKKDH